MRKLLLNSIWISLAFINFALASEKLMSIESQMIDRERTIESLAQDFESTMISKMLKSIYDGVKVDPIAGGGNAETIYRELLLDEYGKAIAFKGGIGVRQSIVKDLKKGDPIYQNLIRQIDDK